MSRKPLFRPQLFPAINIVNAGFSRKRVKKRVKVRLLKIVVKEKGNLQSSSIGNEINQKKLGIKLELIRKLNHL